MGFWKDFFKGESPTYFYVRAILDGTDKDPLYSWVKYSMVEWKFNEYVRNGKPIPEELLRLCERNCPQYDLVNLILKRIRSGENMWSHQHYDEFHATVHFLLWKGIEPYELQADLVRAGMWKQTASKLMKSERLSREDFDFEQRRWQLPAGEFDRKMEQELKEMKEKSDIARQEYHEDDGYVYWWRNSYAFAESWKKIASKYPELCEASKDASESDQITPGLESSASATEPARDGTGKDTQQEGAKSALLQKLGQIRTKTLDNGLPDLPPEWTTMCSLAFLFSAAAFQQPCVDDLMQAAAELAIVAPPEYNSLQMDIQRADSYTRAICAGSDPWSSFGLGVLEHATMVTSLDSEYLAQRILPVVKTLASTVGNVKDFNQSVVNICEASWSLD